MEPWSNIDVTGGGNQASFQPPLATPKDNPAGASYGKSDGELITKYIYHPLPGRQRCTDGSRRLEVTRLRAAYGDFPRPSATTAATKNSVRWSLVGQPG